jgi:hypothetical protein
MKFENIFLILLLLSACSKPSPEVLTDRLADRMEDKTEIITETSTVTVGIAVGIIGVIAVAAAGAVGYAEGWKCGHKDVEMLITKCENTQSELERAKKEIANKESEYRILKSSADDTLAKEKATFKSKTEEISRAADIYRSKVSRLEKDCAKQVRLHGLYKIYMGNNPYTPPTIRMVTPPATLPAKPAGAPTGPTDVPQPLMSSLGKLLPEVFADE